MNTPGGNNPTGAKTWPAERIEKLKQLWDAGRTAAEIAAMMGGGITRNAVIGAARRAGCRKRPSPINLQPGRTKMKRDDYSPSDLRQAAARQNDAFSARLAAAMQATDSHGHRPRVARNIIGSAAASAKARAVTSNPFAGPAPKAQPAAIAKPALVEQVPLPGVDLGGSPDSRDVPFAMLSANGCKFATTPHNARVSDHRFCGAPRMSGSSWCAKHAEKARGKAAQDAGGPAKVEAA